MICQGIIKLYLHIHTLHFVIQSLSPPPTRTQILPLSGLHSILQCMLTSARRNRNDAVYPTLGRITIRTIASPTTQSVQRITARIFYSGINCLVRTMHESTLLAAVLHWQQTPKQSRHNASKLYVVYIYNPRLLWFYFLQPPKKTSFFLSFPSSRFSTYVSFCRIYIHTIRSIRSHTCKTAVF